MSHFDETPVRMEPSLLDDASIEILDLNVACGSDQRAGSASASAPGGRTGRVRPGDELLLLEAMSPDAS
jgi:hypothetical protein